MWAIRDRKTGEYVMKLYRDTGVGLPDLHMTDSAKNAKIYKSRIEANDLVDRFRDYGSPLRLEVIKVWGRTPN